MGGSERVHSSTVVLERGQRVGCMFAAMPKLSMHMTPFEIANIELTQ